MDKLIGKAAVWPNISGLKRKRISKTDPPHSNTNRFKNGGGPGPFGGRAHTRGVRTIWFKIFGFVVDWILQFFLVFLWVMDLGIKLMDWIGDGICINISKIDELVFFG